MNETFDVGVSTARTPGATKPPRPRRGRSRACATGARSTATCSMPGRRTSTVYSARPAARTCPSKRGASPPTTASSAPAGQVSRSSSSSTSAQTSSTRPSISRVLRTRRAIRTAPAARRIALDLRVRAAASTGCRPWRPGSPRGRTRRVLEQRRRRDDLARRAEAALKGVLGDERLLERRRAVA